MEDVDGLIVGSPVKFLGVQIGHVMKIQIITTDVYIKFVVTQKDLNLPEGSIATVEASGLGGSKSLEIYPPEKDNTTDKIILTNYIDTHYFDTIDSTTKDVEQFEYSYLRLIVKDEKDFAFIFLVISGFFNPPSKEHFYI